MKEEKVKGFMKVIVASTVTEGISFLWVKSSLLIHFELISSLYLHNIPSHTSFVLCFSLSFELCQLCFDHWSVWAAKIFPIIYSVLTIDEKTCFWLWLVHFSLLHVCCVTVITFPTERRVLALEAWSPIRWWSHGLRTGGKDHSGRVLFVSKAKVIQKAFLPRGMTIRFWSSHIPL